MYTLATLMLMALPLAQSASLAQATPSATTEQPAQAAASSGLRAITHEDLWLARRLGAPVLSPDGSKVLLSVVDPAYDPAQTTADLWLLETSGKLPARRLTATRASEAAPTFSPDGGRIAFSSQREGDVLPQIYEMDLARGGEAMPITRLSGGARAPQYSPDGKSILLVSSVFPEADGEAAQQRIIAERKARKHNVRIYTGFPIRNWDKWLDERQQRLFVQPLDGGPARDLLAGSELVRQPGFGGRFTDTGEELDAVWSPDGKSVIFAASINRHRGAHSHTHADLYKVDLAGGEPVRLTAGDGLQAADGYGRPQFSPDGKTLYALLQPRTDRVFNASRLAAFSWPQFRPGAVFSTPEQRGITSFALSGDSRTLYLLGEDAGQEVLFHSPAQRADVRAMARQTAGVYANLSSARSASPRGATLVANYDSAGRLPEIVLLDPRTGAPRAISGFNQALQAQLDLPPVQHVWTESRGKRIHSMLVKPAGFDPARKYPLLVLMHGGPHLQWRDAFVVRWNYHLLAGTEFVLLLTNYSGSTGFGEAFAQSIQGDPLKGPAQEINEAADQVIATHPFIDGSRQCAGGASYGGHLANWMQASTTRYRCLISHAGLVNLEAQWGSSDLVYSREANMGGPPWELGAGWSEQNPIRYAGQFQTPTLVTIGEQDFRVPLNNSIEYWSALQRQQVESRLVVFPDENHWILKGENSRYFYGEVDAWLRRWLLD